MASEKSDQRQWFLRIAGGTIFGPVSTKGLIVWAEQGRVVPGNEVSTDRTQWIAADTVPELGMTWYVDDGAGKTVGPFNRVAAESFLKSGKAPAGARLVEGQPAAPAAPEPAAPAAPATPPPRPATARRASTPASAPASDADTSDRRIQELEAALEKRRELLNQLEKDARQRERKIEVLKEEVARLKREQAEQPPDPVRVVPGDGDVAGSLDDLRRTVEDERRCMERDAELLRARLREREAELAACKTSAGEALAAAETLRAELELARAEARDASDDRVNEHLADNERLRSEISAARQEIEGLCVRAATLDSRVAELASQLGQRETECRKLIQEREALQQQLGSAMTAAADATNENTAPASDLRRRLEQQEAVNEGLRAELADAEKALESARASQADLLEVSNTRDVASRQRIAELDRRVQELEAQAAVTPTERETRLAGELAQMRARLAEVQGRLARVPEAGADRAPVEADEWLRQFASDELTALDKTLQDERDSLSAFRHLSTSRQEAIQARIQSMQRLLSGAVPETRARPPGRDRGAGLDGARLQSELEDLRQNQQKAARQFEERETELLARIRILEVEEARLRTLVDESDMQGGRMRELVETARRREQDLSLERRNREQEREQFQATRHALLTRIEELERAAGTLNHGPVPAPDLPGVEPRHADGRRLSSFSAWLRR